MGFRVPRVQVVPLPDDQVSFRDAGIERLGWHASSRYPRPFFFPLIGPAAISLTRMGHPAAPDHNHHRSLWLGHHDVAGVNFWEERGGSQQVRQESWVHYQDGEEEAGMVVRVGWFDAHKVKLITQDLIAVYRPLPHGESWLELQMRFAPALDELKLGKTNFGFIGLRVAASLSKHYGGGTSSNSEGGKGETGCFAKPAVWLDYSGPILPGEKPWEGITWFDHPKNPGSPVAWHIRDDGWMSPAFNLREAYTLKKSSPLVLRYALHVHSLAVQPKEADKRARAFAESAAWEVVAAKRPWRVALRRKAS
jgi:hypothetical protein